MAGIHFDITADNTHFINSLNQTRSALRATVKEIESQGITTEQYFKNIKQAAGALAAGFSAKAFINQIVQVRGEFQQLEVAFKTMLGSEEKAATLMEQLTKTAAVTPFDLQGVTNGAKQLLAYGISADEVNDKLIHLGDIAAGLSLPLNDLVYLYGTTMTQGRMFTQDLRQFMGRGIPIAEELAKIFNTTKDKVADLVTAGKVGAKEFNQAIMAMSSEGGKFAGLMEAQSKTSTGQISNIGDAIESMFNNMGKQSEGIINGTLGVVSSLVENYQKVGEVIGGVVATYGTYKAAVMTVTALQGLQAAGLGALTTAETVHYGWLVLCEKAQKLLNATMLANPYVLAATAVAGLVAVMVTMKSEQERVNEAYDEYNQKKSDIIRKEEEHKARIEELARVAGDESLSTDTRRMALVELEQKYPAIFAKYDTEAEKLKHIRDLKAEIAALDGKGSITNASNELSNVEKRIKELEKKGSFSLASTNSYAGTHTSSRTRSEEAELKALQRRRSELTNQIRKDEGNAYLTNLTGVSNEDLKRQIDERRNLLARMGVSDKKYGKTKQGGATGVYTRDELQGQLQILQSEQARRKKVLEDSSKDFVAEANKAYKKEQDALRKLDSLTDPKKRSKSKLEIDGKKVSDMSGDEFLEAIEKQQQAVDEAKKKVDAYNKAKNGGSSKDDTAAREDAARRQKLLEQELSDRERHAKQLEVLSDAQAEAAIASEQSRQKRELMQMEKGHRDALSAIDRQADEMRRANYEAQKKAWEAQNTDKTKSWADTDIAKEVEANGYAIIKLTEEQTATLHALREKENADYARNLKERIDAEEQANREAINSYLHQYGDYAQKKQAIYDDANAEICKLEEQLSDATTNEAREAVEARINLVRKGAEQQVEDLDVQYGKAKQFMIDLFGDASKKSVAEIEKIIKKYEELEKFLQGDSTVTRKDLVSLGFTNKELDQALDKLSQGKITVKDYTDALKNMRGELAERSPWQKFKKDIGDAVDMLKAANGDNTKIGTAITNIGKACSDYMPEVERFSSAIYNLFGVDDKGARSAISAMQGLSKAAEGVGQIVSGQWMDGVVNAVDGVSQAFNGLADMIDDIGSRRDLDAEFNKIELKAIRKAVDKIVDKFEGDSIANAINDYNEAMALYTESLERAQSNVQDAFSKSSSNIAGRYNHHSINYYMNEIGSKDDINKINELLGVNLDSFSELWFLSPDQLAEVEEKLPHVFAIIEKGIEEMSENASASSDDEDARAMLEAYMELVGKKKEIEDAFTLKMTGTTVTSVKSDFKNMLSDMTSDAETFSEHFEEMIRNSVINALMSDKYNAALEEWYQLFSSYYQNDSKLGEDEIADLRERYKQISDEAIAERDALVNAMADAEETMASSFDSLRSSFRSALLDMEGDTREWGKNIAQIMTEALVDRFVLGEDFDKWLNEWAKSYESIANATFKNKNDGTFLSTNPEEIEAEKARLQEIVDMWGWLADRPIEMMTRDAIMLEHREEAIAALEALAKLDEYETYTEGERAAAIAELNNQLQKEMDLRKQMAKVYADMTGWTLWQKIDASPLANIGDELISALQDTSKGVEDWKKEIVDSLTNDLIKQIVYNDAFKEHIRALQEQYVHLFDTDENGNRKLSDAEIQKGINDIVNALAGLYDDAEKATEGLKELVPDIDTSPFDNLRDRFLDTLMDMQGDTESFKRKLQETLVKDLMERQVLDVPLTVTIDGEDKVFENFDKYSEDWNKRYLNAVKSGNTDLADTLIDELMQVYGLTMEQAEGLRERLKEIAKDTTFKDMTNSWVSNLMDFNATAEDWAENIGRTMAQKIIEQMIVPTLIQPLLDNLQTAFDTAMSEHGEYGTDWDWKKVIGADGVHEALQAIQAAYPELKETITAILAALNITPAAEDAKEAFNDLTGTIISGLTDAEMTAEEFSKNIARTLTEQLMKQIVESQFAETMKGIQEDWAKALESGDTSAIEAIRQRIVQLYKDAGRATDELRGIFEEVKEGDTTFKDMADSWLSALFDMDSTAADFGRKIGQTLVQKLIGELVVSKQLQSYLDDIQIAYNNAIGAEGATVESVLAAVTPKIDEAVEATKEWKPVVEEIAKAFREIDNSTPLDNLRSSFLSSLMSIEDDTKNFAGNISEILREAFIDKFVLGDTFDAQLKEWQDEYRRIMGDTSADDSERARQLKVLKEAITQYRDQMAGEAKAINDLFGTAEYADQQATMNMSDKITYEQADMLLGVNVAQQIIQQQILDTLQSISGITSPNGQMVTEMRNLMIQANGHLSWIHEYSKKIYDDFGLKLNDILNRLTGVL